MERLTGTPIERDVIITRGVDAQDYLNSQLTQDVSGLVVGDSAWSFLLEPKSEIVALLRITRTEDMTLVLDTEPGYGQAILDRIDGFLFRMDVEFSLDRWSGVAWRGPGSEDVDSDAPIRMPSPWPGVEGLDVIGPGVEVPPDAEVFAHEELDALRIRLGWPSMGDIDDTTTPAMTGIIDHTVSFTKGCYTGQEFVARVHYREAAPPRRLVQIGFHPCLKPERGEPIVLDGEEVGELTTVSAHQPLALGFLKRSVEAPGEAECAGSPVCLGLLPAHVAQRAKPRPRGGTSRLTFQSK
jgi:folate-binding protein YgfZ